MANLIQRLTVLLTRKANEVIAETFEEAPVLGCATFREHYNEIYDKERNKIKFADRKTDPDEAQNGRFPIPELHNSEVEFINLGEISMKELHERRSASICMRTKVRQMLAHMNYLTQVSKAITDENSVRFQYPLTFRYQLMEKAHDEATHLDSGLPTQVLDPLQIPGAFRNPSTALDQAVCDALSMATVSIRESWDSFIEVVGPRELGVGSVNHALRDIFGPCGTGPDWKTKVNNSTWKWTGTQYKDVGITKIRNKISHEYWLLPGETSDYDAVAHWQTLCHVLPRAECALSSMITLLDQLEADFEDGLYDESSHEDVDEGSTQVYDKTSIIPDPNDPDLLNCTPCDLDSKWSMYWAPWYLRVLYPLHGWFDRFFKITCMCDDPERASTTLLHRYGKLSLLGKLLLPWLVLPWLGPKLTSLMQEILQLDSRTQIAWPWRWTLEEWRSSVEWLPGLRREQDVEYPVETGPLKTYAHEDDPDWYYDED